MKSSLFSPLYSLRQVSQLNLELASRVNLASPLALRKPLPPPCLLSTGIAGRLPHTPGSVCSGDLTVVPMVVG